MGVADAGQTVTRNLVVRGRSPFRILTVRSTDARFHCQAPAGPASDHYILPVTFAAKASAAPAGRVAAKHSHRDRSAGCAADRGPRFHPDRAPGGRRALAHV